MRAEPIRDQFPRLLALLTYLAETGGAHINELAYHFSVSPERIVKDLNTLWVSGLPGESPEDLIDFNFNDSNTFVSLLQGLGLDRPLRLTPRETISLLLLLRAIKPEVTDELLSSELSVLTAELTALVPAAQVPQLETAGTCEADRWRGFIRSRKVIHFCYVSGLDQVGYRTVDPLRIEETASGWYLLAYCHQAQAVRSFALSQISEEAAVDTEWLAPPDALVGHSDVPETTTVSLQTDPSLAWLAEQFSAPNPKLTAASRLLFDLEFYSKERMIRTLLSVADRVDTISPQPAADLVANRARDALTRMAQVHQLVRRR